MTSNAERTVRTRGVLIRAARAMFAEGGYADTSTPSITAEAGVSRGALYHHFEDKAGLFRAVIVAEQDKVTEAINAVPVEESDPVGTMIAAGEAFLDVMRDAGARRLLYVEGPSVLGEKAMRDIDAERGGQTLAVAIDAAVSTGAFRHVPVQAMADLMSAAYDRAAAEGTAEHREAIRQLIEGLRVPAPAKRTRPTPTRTAPRRRKAAS